LCVRLSTFGLRDLAVSLWPKELDCLTHRLAQCSSDHVGSRDRQYAFRLSFRIPEPGHDRHSAVEMRAQALDRSLRMPKRCGVYITEADQSHTLAAEPGEVPSEQRPARHARRGDALLQQQLPQHCRSGLIEPITRANTDD